MQTENRNPRTENLDQLSTAEMVKLINEEDRTVALAVAAVLPEIARAVDAIAERMFRGGRLIYAGAGTSGRLGLLDAVECPPTFGVSPQLVVGIMAGGNEANSTAFESAEDDPVAAVQELKRREVSPDDIVVGIAASGRTPFTCSALKAAREAGALTVAIANNPGSELGSLADIAIEIDTGPEVLAGSTRMKAGTSQKMVLNMLSTASMVRLGHVYGNLMVNVLLKNRKLFRRGVGIVQQITGAGEPEATKALQEAGDVRTAVVMIARKCSAARAREQLARTGTLRAVLELDGPGGQSTGPKLPASLPREASESGDIGVGR